MAPLPAAQFKPCGTSTDTLFFHTVSSPALALIPLLSLFFLIVFFSDSFNASVLSVHSHASVLNLALNREHARCQTSFSFICLTLNSPLANNSTQLYSISDSM
ncbi:hypothetical protein CHARACLAT_019938 [Characodon lateralis]|uniref:Uncharacterized protein n=1 Tax=Characodon lateralis TaxID=208331 RepID=A0ABU7END1_9TELE|nr:hypothetical protein [Characodon lateralis]